MKKFEYNSMIEEPSNKTWKKEIVLMGEDGWELVGVQNVRLETGMLFTVAYLKREKL